MTSRSWTWRSLAARRILPLLALSIAAALVSTLAVAFTSFGALTAFLIGAQARGYRSVLVITGQGRRGGSGVIRASVHEWLQSPALRGVVSGFASAARHHGGDGALYVTIRRG